MRSRHFMTSLFFIWSHFTFFRSYFKFARILSYKMPLFNKKEKKKYQRVAANYIPLPEVKELTPSFPELR